MLAGFLADISHTIKLIAFTFVCVWKLFKKSYICLENYFKNIKTYLKTLPFVFLFHNFWNTLSRISCFHQRCCSLRDEVVLWLCKTHKLSATTQKNRIKFNNSGIFGSFKSCRQSIPIWYRYDLANANLAIGDPMQ